MTSEASFAIADNGASPCPVIPDDLPADIQHLTNAYKGGLPVIVISHVNWPHFPLRITSSFCKFIVLGFFHMISIHVSKCLRYVVFPFFFKKKGKTIFKLLIQYMSLQSDVTPVRTNEVGGSQYNRGHVTWIFRLRWVSGGDPDRYAAGPMSEEPRLSDIIGYLDDPTPWWMTVNAAATARGRLSAVPGCPPFVAPVELDVSILDKYIARERYKVSIMLLVLPSRMWQCSACGKVNKLRWMGRYPCTNCAGASYRVCFLFLLLLSRGYI